MEPRQYTTERGVTISIVPIPLLLDEIRKAHPMPPPPTYVEHLAGGATEEVGISEEQARAWQTHDPEGWAPHAEKWAEYKRNLDAIQERLNDRIWQAVLRRAIRVDLPADNTWIAEQRDLGLTVPENERDRHVHYIRTEVLGGMHDILKITAIANGADLSEEALATAEASFRGSLARNLARGLANRGRAVADGDASSDDAGSEAVAPPAQ